MIGLLAAIAALTVVPVSAEAAKKPNRTVKCTQEATGGLNVSEGRCIVFKKAKLVNGKAVAPASAPKKIKRVIARANEIEHLPYNWGGGRATWPNIDSNGYDCSGAVSYAIRGLGRRALPSPLPSGPLMSWGKRGRGKWLTVYSNPGHVYLVVAGLRFDTSMTPGNGPGWSKSMRSTSGRFVARSWPGY